MLMSDPRLLNLFLDLVKISSPTGSEQELVAFITRFLNLHQISHTQDQFGNLIANIPGQGSRILLTAHLDTVQPCTNICPQVIDGIIRTNGDSVLGADNKAALACILHQIARLPPLHPPLELVFTRSEEVGNLGAVNLDYSLIRSKIGFSFDYGGPLGQIFTQSPFYLRFDIALIGKAAHASTPLKARNVLPQVAKLLTQIPTGQPLPDTTLNIGLLNAGSARNTVPGTASLSGEIRSFSLPHLEQVETNVKSYLPPQAKYSSYLENPGFVIQSDNPALKLARRALASAKLTPKPTVTHACFDANIFISHGINIINMSDGSKDNHTTRESISLISLLKLSDLVSKLISVSSI